MKTICFQVLEESIFRKCALFVYFGIYLSNNNCSLILEYMHQIYNVHLLRNNTNHNNHNPVTNNTKNAKTAKTAKAAKAANAAKTSKTAKKPKMPKTPKFRTPDKVADSNPG